MSSDRTPGRRAAATLAWLALLVAGAHAAPGAPARSGVLRLDPARTVVSFRLPGGLHDTHGTFRLKQGTIEVDGATGGASGLVVVDATSGDTGNARRDAKMKTDVLGTASHPEIVFRPTRADGALEADGSFRGTLHGILALRGAEHEVAIATEGRAASDRVTATGRFVVPYVAWGLENPSFLFFTVGDEVHVEVSAAGDVTWGPNAPEESDR